MKVLWLCNIMLPKVAEYLGLEASNKEGWLSGLMAEVLGRKNENNIELAVAFPAPVGCECGEKHICDGKVIYKGALSEEEGGLKWYAFCEDVGNPHLYDDGLELQMHYITRDFAPDVVHCFGTEYPHTLAMCRAFPGKERILVGIQGLCSVYANTYFASLPKGVVDSITLRDILRKDTLKIQQDKFVKRGEMEIEALKLAGNVTGRTAWDKHYTVKWNPKANYYHMNETLRSNFYEGKWEPENCEPHSIFLSQGDYPIKGVHYMLSALPAIREKYPDVKVYVAGADLTKADTLKQKLKLSAYGKYLRKLIKKHKLQDNVCFVGRLSAAEMKERYLKSSLFVCPSSIQNSPNSLGEAMILGVPCVSANVGGIASIFEADKDGILYEGFETPRNSFNNGSEQKVVQETSLESQVEALANAVLTMWSDEKQAVSYGAQARKHAAMTHNGEQNYKRMLEIYEDIAGRSAEPERQAPTLAFVSNYINHHQIPFCNEMYRLLGNGFVFIQTEAMEEERKQMGWQEETALPYVKFYYDEPELCKSYIADAQVVLFGGSDEESYIVERLQAKKPVVRYSERLYKSGQWKAISPRGLMKKYKDHTKYRKQNVYMLCAGAYVVSDFSIVKAYPGKLLKWGYFPETKHYDVDKLMAEKKPASILWAARFIDWKHPELALQTAKYLKEKGCEFRLNMVGGGEMDDTVKAMLEQYELSDCVTLLGYRTPKEVRKLMEQSDIFVQTSDRKEGWGAVINEAMNSGCAVVANHMIGAAPFLIRHGENGFVYRDGNEKELYQTVEMLLKDRILCQKAGREAYETITLEWNAENAAIRLLALCVKLGFLQESRVVDFASAGADGGIGIKSEAWEKSLNPTDGPCAVCPVISEKQMYSLLVKESKGRSS